MSSERMLFADLMWGSLRVANPQLPIQFQTYLRDLRPRFIPKGQVGRGHRYVARNGKILLASDRGLDEFAEGLVRIRVQVWRKAVLPGDHPEPYGLLVCIRLLPTRAAGPIYCCCLAKNDGGLADLAIDVGGGMIVRCDRAETTIDYGRADSRLRTSTSK